MQCHWIVYNGSYCKIVLSDKLEYWKINIALDDWLDDLIVVLKVQWCNPYYYNIRGQLRNQR